MIVVFDLDDTLYDESTFVRSGFRAVAGHLALRLDFPAPAIFDRLVAELDARGRGAVFNAVLAAEKIDDPVLVDECLEVYRSHDPEICPYPAAMVALERHAELPMYVVTDGNPDVQARKIAALGIEDRFRDVYCTWNHGHDFAKPSLRCFNMICEREGQPLSALVHVADDPSKDFVGLRRGGASTVRVMTGRFSSTVAKDGYDAEHRIGSLAELNVPQLPAAHQDTGAGSDG